MYISQINTHKRGMGDIYTLHQRLWEGFSGDSSRERDFLFRSEPKQGKRMTILVQSLTRPQWEGIFPPAEYQIKSYEPAFATGQQYFFLAQLTASVSKSNGPGKQPSRVPLPWEQYEHWFSDQGGSRGYEALTVSRVGEVFVVSYKKERLRIAGQTLSGVLRVTDADAFLTTYQNGLGRGRAFGFGMLSLKKIQG